MNHQIAVGFVAMPFDEISTEFWREAKRAADGFEYLIVERYGSDSHSGGDELFTAIRKQIKKADFAIADFTCLENGGPNFNVLTEAGIAIGADVSLYVMARGRNFDRVMDSLPSDWHGSHVELFSESRASWRSTFDDFFRRILHDLDRPSLRKIEPKRQSDAERLNWLMQLVRRLKSKCGELYDSQYNGVRWKARFPPGYGLPRSYFFNLRSQQPPNESVQVGVFFNLWLRGGTPLWIYFAEGGVAKRIPIKLGLPLDVITSDEAIDDCVRHLDWVLRRITPRLRNPDSLGQRMSSWLSCDGAAAILEVCRELQLNVNGRGNWTEEGFLVEVQPEDSRLQLRIGISFELWSERGVTPYWISIRPCDSESPEILRSVNLPWLRPHVAPGELLVPIPFESDDFSNSLRTRLERVLRGCSRSSQGQRQNDDVDSDDELLGGVDESESETLPECEETEEILRNIDGEEAGDVDVIDEDLPNDEEDLPNDENLLNE